ncbi:ead/Ea22-like family protein [Enterobacter roggenkampii]|uniref:ead/Ea22-like family protein n=1 Tax=Enterobacter roggenkampii TaxID=1812935 RepID=UPI0023797AF5|nr:ead/Ea22-like family protein [Enterobacter roggenkampii]MDD9239915.1 ead/Ea22-like family protein [Enterobacter roggenkampii]
MSNIDKRALREAAEKATPGVWVYIPKNTSIEYDYGSDDSQGSITYMDSGDFTQKQTDLNGAFIAAANPATVLALLDELEAVQTVSAARLGAIDTTNKMFQRERDRAEKAEKRIAELEAREIKPVNGEVLVTVAGFTGCGKSAIAGEIEIAMKAIGVPVKWANGDAEKRMTGADWLTAIEMYKPSVRIVEVNVPRTAAGKGEES